MKKFLRRHAQRLHTYSTENSEESKEAIKAIIGAMSQTTAITRDGIEMVDTLLTYRTTFSITESLDILQSHKGSKATTSLLISFLRRRARTMTGLEKQDLLRALEKLDLSDRQLRQDLETVRMYLKQAL
jgi:hypothetical protein